MDERLDEINWLINLFNKWCTDLEIAIVAHEFKNGGVGVAVEDQRDGKRYAIQKAREV